MAHITDLLIRRGVYEKALDKWGRVAQVFMLFEEMAELQKAVCKWERDPSREKLMAIADEVADVRIMLEQIQIVFGIEEARVKDIMTAKVGRLAERLGM